jgi:hypothetical protein
MRKAGLWLLDQESMVFYTGRDNPWQPLLLLIDLADVHSLKYCHTFHTSSAPRLFGSRIKRTWASEIPGYG